MRELPEGWEWTELSTISSVVTGKTPSTTNEGFWNGNIPFVTPSQIDSFGKITPTNRHLTVLGSAQARIVPENSTLAVCIGTVGKIGLLDRPSVINQQINAIVVSNFISNKFLYYWSQYFLRPWIIENASATVNASILNKSRLESAPVVLPPLNEQKRIADRLDQLLTRIDKTKAHLNRIPPLLKRFRQSVLAAATSGKLTADWREENSLNQWLDTTIGELTTEIRYGTSKKCDYEPQATPVLRIPNISDGQIRHKDMKFAEFDNSELKKLALSEGDILVIRSNGSLSLVGKTALVSEKENGFLFAGYLIRLRMKQGIANPKFISLHISSPSVQDVIEITARSTSGVNNINTEEIKALEISLPTLEEQQEIIRRVEALFAKADRIEAQYKNARQQVDRLTPALLAKAFRGELVPQDPNDESASVLLERVKEARSM